MSGSVDLARHDGDDLPVLDRISDYATRWAERHPSREALVLDDERITYGALAEGVSRWARWLIDAGVARGDRVALLSDPRPDAITIFLATASIGAVFQGLSPRHRTPELAYKLENAQPAVLLNGDPETSASTIDTLADSSTRIKRVGGPDLATLLADAGTVSDATLHDLQAQVKTLDPAALVYTAGSTGKPKGALLPHRGFTWPSHVQAEHWFEGESGAMLNNLPIDHVGSLGNISCTTLVSGGTIVFQERFDAVGVLSVIERERVNYWPAVPAMFLLSVRTGAWKNADLSSITKFIWSGGAAPISLIGELRRRCDRLSNSYGLTETVGEVTFSDPADDLETLASTIGRPEPRYEVRLVRDDGMECDQGEDGEIVVRGDFIMRGYLNAPEATAEAIDSEGWLHTGDIARRRADGCFTLVGRKKEMFKSGGYNVYPREIELELEGHTAVRLAAVVGIPDDTYGEVGHAFVLADPAEVNREHLAAFLKERLASYKIPKEFTIAPDLPRTAVGKIDKIKLRRNLLRD